MKDSILLNFIFSFQFSANFQAMGIVVAPTIPACKEYGTKESKIVPEKVFGFLDISLRVVSFYDRKEFLIDTATWAAIVIS